jgi:hypothetical protein
MERNFFYLDILHHYFFFHVWCFLLHSLSLYSFDYIPWIRSAHYVLFKFYNHVINADNKNISNISAQNIVVKQLAACSCAEACFCLIFWTLNFAYALHSNVIFRLILCLLNCATYLHNRLQWIKLNNLGEMWKPIPPGQMSHTSVKSVLFQCFCFSICI